MLREQIEKYIPYNQQEKKDKEVILKYIDTFDNLLVRENEFAHFTASNWIVNPDRTKVLMVFHNIYKSWSWTGGHADGDENLLHVAIKEAEEETGIHNFKVLEDSLFSLELITVDGHVKRGKYISSHIHINGTFLLEADENQKIRIKEDENSDVRWINIEDSIKVTNEPKMIPIYTKLIEKLNDMKR